jgi:hypothetical protein
MYIQTRDLGNPMHYFRRTILILGLVCAGGCHEAPTNPDTTVETFRMATKGELSLGILNVAPGPDGFPLATVNLRSLTNDEIIVSYAPRCLAIHCGTYVQFGPPATYGIRREILDAFGYMDFPPPSSGWANHSDSGQIELIHPTRLPAGNYDLWATLYLAGPDGGTLQTPHQVYKCPGAGGER